MKNNSITLGLLLVVALIIVPEASAYGSYVGPLTSMYGSGSCGTCHVNPNGGGARNAYGTLFENQANHMSTPTAALNTIGAPDGVTPTPSPVPTTASTSKPSLKRIKVVPSSANLVAGGTQTFIAKTLDQFNQVISALVAWASSNPSVGTIDSNGKFTALADGTTTITASNGTINASAIVTVSSVSSVVSSNQHNEHNENDLNENDQHDDVHHNGHQEQKEVEHELEDEFDED